MADTTLKIQQASGVVTTVEIPDHVPIKDLLPELVACLKLPTFYSDGRPKTYRYVLAFGQSPAGPGGLGEATSGQTAPIPVDEDTR